MKEFLRIVNATKNRGESEQGKLQGYHLELHQGEAVYVYGQGDSGIRMLPELFEGNLNLSAGEIWIAGQKVKPGTADKETWKAVYVCDGRKELAENLSVAENFTLCAVKNPLLHIWNQDLAKRETKSYFERENIQMPVDAPVASLAFIDRLKLSLLKAKKQRTKVIVLNCIRMPDETKNATLLTGMLEQEMWDGIAFLILSERMNPLIDQCGRVQLISRGRDRMEWGREQAKDFIRAEQERSGKLFQQENKENTGRRIGEEGIWKNGAVYVPRESGVNLPKNLTVAQNIILSVPERVTAFPYGRIPPDIENAAALQFYRETGIDPKKTKISQLTYVERKILSIYRFLLAKPETIILEDAYWGMDIEEVEQFQLWLKEVANRGINLIIND